MATESAIATQTHAAPAEQLTIEERFDLEIANADLSEIKTVDDVIAYAERRLETPASGSAASSGGAQAS